MNTAGDIDQFDLLAEKIDRLIESVALLKKEKESIAEKAQIQEERLADLTAQLEGLKTARDKAKQKVVSLLEKIEHLGV
jgi:FtsZ-binding cell division protein ZapB